MVLPPASLPPVIPGPDDTRWDGLCWLTFAVFCLSSFVMIEPSLFDVLFPPLSLLLVWRLRTRIAAHPALLQLCCLVLLWAVLGGLSLSLSPKLLSAIIYHAVTIYLLVLLVVASLLFAAGSPALRSALLLGYIVGVLISALAGIGEMLHLLPTEELFTKFTRLKGTYKDPNVFGPAAGFALLLVAYGGLKVHRRALINNAVRLAAAGILGFAVLLTYSRASLALMLFGLIAAGGLLFLSLARGRLSPLAMLAVLSASALLVAGLMALPSLVDLSFLQSRLAIQWYDLDRFKIQGLALKASMTRPLGIGPGGSEDFFIRYAAIQKTGATHNTYLRVLIENGWLALLLFLLIVASAFVTGGAALVRGLERAYASGQDHRLLIIASVTMTLHMGMGLVIDMIHWRHFFVALALLFGTALRCQQRALADSQFDRPV